MVQQHVTAFYSRSYKADKFQCQASDDDWVQEKEENQKTQRSRGSNNSQTLVLKSPHPHLACLALSASMLVRTNTTLVVTSHSPLCIWEQLSCHPWTVFSCFPNILTYCSNFSLILACWCLSRGTGSLVLVPVPTNQPTPGVLSGLQ